MNQYYISQQKKMIKDLKKFLKLIAPKLKEYYGENNISEIHHATIDEYKKLIPQFPYIGGKKNSLTSNLTQGCFVLALYNVVKQYGGTAQQAGEMASEGLSLMLDKIPAFIRKIVGRLMLRKKRLAKIKKKAERSQLKEYPEDWVWSVKVCNNENCDVAIDYTECGIKKFFYAQGAEELVPYLCRLDYIMFEKIGLNLNRTKTLAEGCDCCNFRISK